MMKASFSTYIEDTMLSWTASSLTAVQQWKGFKGKESTARSLHSWAHSFIINHEDLPFNLYGTWNTSLLHNGDLARDIFEHLQSIGEYVSASHIVQFLNTPEIWDHYLLTKSISIWMVQQWMHLMDYQWTKMPHGQYKDGHEHEDVVAYWQEKYIPVRLMLYVKPQQKKERERGEKQR